MSRRTRGRALIINILFSSSQQQRHGSRADYANISQCLKDLGFELVKAEQQLTDLTAQVFTHFYVISPVHVSAIKCEIKFYLKVLFLKSTKLILKFLECHYLDIERLFYKLFDCNILVCSNLNNS